MLNNMPPPPAKTKGVDTSRQQAHPPTPPRRGSTTLQHGLINHIDTKTKMSSSKKMTCKGNLRQVFICLRPRNPYPPLTHCTVYEYTVCIQGKGKGWRVEPERRGQGATQEITDPKDGLKNTNLTECTQEIGNLQFINTCRKVPLQVNFLNFALPSLSLLFLRLQGAAFISCGN